MSVTGIRENIEERCIIMQINEYKCLCHVTSCKLRAGPDDVAHLKEVLRVSKYRSITISISTKPEETEHTLCIIIAWACSRGVRLCRHAVNPSGGAQMSESQRGKSSYIIRLQYVLLYILYILLYILYILLYIQTAIYTAIYTVYSAIYTVYTAIYTVYTILLYILLYILYILSRLMIER